MKREIDGRVFDTTQATLVASDMSSSTHVHRAVSLYRSADGHYFLVEEREIHGIDGALLTPFSESMAREWLTEHGKGEIASELFG